MNLCSTSHAGIMGTGRLTTPSGSATSAVQERHRNTSGEIYLLHQMNPDVTIGDATTGVVMTGIVMTSNARTKGGTASRLHHQGTATSTRTRTPLTSCSPAILILVHTVLY